MAARDPRYTDRSAERSLLGGMLIDNNRIVLTAGRVGYSDFSERLHGEIFYCIGEIIKAGRVATPVTLKECMPQETFDNLIYPEAGDVTIGSYLANLAAAADNSDPVSLAVRIRQLTALNTIIQLTRSFDGHEVDDILQAADCLAFDADFIATAMRAGNATTSEPPKEPDQLERLRGAGWSIAVHNDFSGGVYWMMAHNASGRFISTTAGDDSTALGILLRKSRTK